MTTTMGICELGMINDLHQLDIIGHNLANASTSGYKRDIAVHRSFESVLGDTLPLPGSGMEGLRQYDPVPQVRRMVDYSPGALKYTGNSLDVAIEGDAYFELSGRGGVRYSRCGSFTMDAAGRLVNTAGMVVSGQEGEILLNGGNVDIDSDGKVNEDGKYVGQLKLVKFAGSSSLQKSGGGMWFAPAGTVAQPANGASVRQGFVESSNVSAMDEMVRMITTLHHFEATANVIKGYDEMVNTAISTIAEF